MSHPEQQGGTGVEGARGQSGESGKEAPDPGIRSSVVTVAVTAMVLAALSGFGFGVPAALGVLAGGALATANLAFFARLVGAFLAQKGNTAPWAVLGMLKLLGLFAIAWILLNSHMFSAIWFAVGYGSLPIGITLSTLLRKPPPDADGAPGSSSHSGDSAPRTESSTGEDTPPDADVLDGPRRD